MKTIEILSTSDRRHFFHNVTKAQKVPFPSHTPGEVWLVTQTLDTGEVSQRIVQGVAGVVWHE